jgi:hypothetical protein
MRSSILTRVILGTGNFKAGRDQGTILKKLCPKEELCFQALMRDVLRPYVPEYKGHFTAEDGERILFPQRQRECDARNKEHGRGGRGDKNNNHTHTRLYSHKLTMRRP